jgi:hypothetical protein
MDFAVVVGVVITGLLVVGATTVVLLLGTLFTFLSNISDAYDDDNE